MPARKGRRAQGKGKAALNRRERLALAQRKAGLDHKGRRGPVKAVLGRREGPARLPRLGRVVLVLGWGKAVSC